MTLNFRRCLIAASILSLSLAHADLQAQDKYPSRAITMIVGWTAGGSADNVSRLIASQMSATLGQPIVIENRAGAGGNIGSSFAAQAKPDGYTVMLATSASHGWNSVLYNTLPYKPIEDFAPIGLINTSPGTLLVAANSPYKSVRDVIEAAKAHPSKLNYGSGGVGSSQHMAGAMFDKLAGIDVLHIPFKGVAPALTELMANRVEWIITTGSLPFIKSGKLRALAVAAHERLPALPDVPTFDQAGLPGFYTENWYGLVAPAGTPRPALDALNVALNKALANPDLQKQFVEQGAFPAKPMSPDAFWAFVRKQMPEAAEQVRLTGAKME